MSSYGGSRIADGLARVAGSAVHIAGSVGQQVRSGIRAKAENMADRLDLVPRTDMDRAEMLIAALNDRIEKLESRLEDLEGKKVTKTTPKPKTKTSKAKKGPS